MHTHTHTHTHTQLAWHSLVVLLTREYPFAVGFLLEESVTPDAYKGGVAVAGVHCITGPIGVGHVLHPGAKRGHAGHLR